MPLLWRSFLHVPWRENSTHPNGAKTSSKEQEDIDHSGSFEAGNPEQTAKDSVKRESVPCRRGVETKRWHVGVMVHREKVDQPKSVFCDGEVDTTDLMYTSSVIDSNDVQSNVPRRRKTSQSCYLLDKNERLHCTQSTESGEESMLFGTSVVFQSDKDQESDQNTEEGAKSQMRQSLKTKISLNGYFGVNLTSSQSTNHQKQQNEGISDLLTRMLGTKQGYVLGYFVGKLTDVYKDAGKCLQSTRKIIRQVRERDMTTLSSSYLTMVGHKPQLDQQQLTSKSKSSYGERKVCFAQLEEGAPLNSSEKVNFLEVQGTKGWPEGSVMSCKVGNPEVLFQRLVKFPTFLSELQSLTPPEMLHRLSALIPQDAATSQQLFSVYWLGVSNFKRPTSQPGCLLLFETELYAITSQIGSHEDDQTLEIFHHSSLLDIREIQVSFAGQQVRLLGSSEDTVLVVHTHNKELTQMLCRTFRNILKVTNDNEDTGAHPLLHEDLLSLSLDWRCHVPDLVLNSQVRITSRFKRDHADLLYFIHGNMEGRGRPSLANIRLFLYTSVEVEHSSQPRQGALLRFLLTDTHVGLVQEDCVLHHMPRTSDWVQSQYREVELRRRSDVRCLLVRHHDNCIGVDVLFSKAHKPQGEIKSKGEVSDYLNRGPVRESWKLTFSCTSEAVILINNLST